MDRSEKPRRYNAGMHAPEQSDRVIVPKKGQNKSRLQRDADAPEGRPRAKENPKEETGPGTQRPQRPAHKFQRVRSSVVYRFAPSSEAGAV